MYYSLTVTVLFLWSSLSDERTGLSFVYAAGPCQRSLSRVRGPWDSRPYFTLSDLRLPVSSPLTTRRLTVEVFNPASPRACLLVILETSLYICGTDNRENTYYYRDMLPRKCLANSLGLYCHSRVFIAPLPSTGHGADHIESTSSVVGWLCNVATICSAVHREHSSYCCVYTESLHSNGHIRHSLSTCSPVFT
jgi:hypothetical protein